MKNISIRFAFLIMSIGLMLSTDVAAQTLITSDISGPAGSVSFGTHVAVLPNGNFVVTDPDYSIVGGAQSVGAVYLFSRQGNLISTLTGSTEDDNVGYGGITVLATGNYVIGNPEWYNGAANTAGAATFGRMTTGVSGVVSAANSLIGSAVDDVVGREIVPLPNGNYLVLSPYWQNVGAVTLGHGNTGISGVVSSSNSLVGSFSGDSVGDEVYVLANGNYVIASRWNDNRGSVTFGTATVPVTGMITSANSLVGSTVGDSVGSNVIALPNGNYVVASSGWDNPSVENVGAVTFGNGTSGTTGEVSPANSMVGSSTGDNVGRRVIALTNNRYVVGSEFWDNGPIVDAGAATFCGSPNGCTGLINSSNSLVGSTASDLVGSYIVPLSNGNYVVATRRWDLAPGSISPLKNDSNVVANEKNATGGIVDVGAVTLGSGTSGITGTISQSNSLLGSHTEDFIGNQITPLTNGNYVATSQDWDNGTVINAGAATFGNGNTGVTGFVNSENSLVGSAAFDSVASGTQRALTNGNYVISSTSWDNGMVVNAGAATFGNGNTGITGVVSPANSLVGNATGDNVGSLVALQNGNYVVKSAQWSLENRGAVTFADGTTGITGAVSESNSLVGSSSSNQIGDNIVPFPNGDYTVLSPDWDTGAATDVGAITYGNGVTGLTGVVSSANSLVGSTTDDNIGELNDVRVLANGYYIVGNRKRDNGAIVDAGFITLSKTALTGPINSNNSIIGTETDEISLSNEYSFDESTKRLYVGRPLLNKVTRAQLSTELTSNTKFDFDGDGKTDVSIFRPGSGEWWYLKSSDGGNGALQFGASTDKIAPGDYTGDGKTDITFWRPSTGEWYILRSEDNSFFSFPFGANGDTPVPADYDGDGKTDAAIFRPSTQNWFILNSSGGTSITTFGIAGDKPVVADYDGDGKADIAIFRPGPGEWWYSRSGGGATVALTFGTSTDKQVQGDYTGDGKADVAFFRPSTGFWFIQRSEDGSFYSVPFGTTGDLPAPGDYDGDGKYDTTVFRPSNSTWFSNRSTAGTMIVTFGIAGDQPVPNAFVP